MVPESYSFGDSVVRTLRAGELIQWKAIMDDSN